MINTLLKSVAENGLTGVLLALSLLAIAWLYNTNKKDILSQQKRTDINMEALMKTHGAERAEMMKQFREQHNEVIALGRDFNITTKETMGIVAEIRGMLQNNTSK